MKRRFVLPAIRASVALAALMLVAGCSNAGTSSTSQACPFALAPTVAPLTSMIAPTSGATGVSPAIGRLEFSSNVPVGQSYQVTLTPTTGTPSVTTVVATLDADTRGSDLAIPQLAAATTYTVTLMPVGPPPCYVFNLASSTFTTQ